MCINTFRNSIGLCLCVVISFKSIVFCSHKCNLPSPLHRYKCSSHKLLRPSISAGFGFIFLSSEILPIWCLVNKEYFSLKYLTVVVTPETFSGETKARNIKLKTLLNSFLSWQMNE